MSKTTEQFIKEAQILWGDKYNYSKTVYINGHTKIEIICNKCNNLFLTVANEHIRKTHKTGCPICAGNIRKTTEQFIREANKIYEDKYDYSRVNYKNSETKIEIGCKKCHSFFFRLACKHLKEEKGCPSCDKIKKDNSEINRINLAERIATKQKQDRKIRIANKTKEFIDKAQEIHNDKYDYSKVIYNNSLGKVKIICNTCHNIFEQSMNYHLLASHCCPTCYAHQIKEQFISDSKTIHGDKYDYSKTDYKNSKTRVKILCKKCNKYFLQIPSSHSNGCGCLCYDRTKICFKDGQIFDSLVEAHYYLKLKDKNLNPLYHGFYGGELGQRLYDFYIPEEHKYVEITGYDKNNYITINLLPASIG